MAKEIKNFKLSELTCTVPKTGQYEGLPYEYEGLKKSLQDEGYKPDKYDYVACTSDGNVLYGGRRIWLMKEDMSMDQSTEVACEIWTVKEFEASIVERLNVSDFMITKKDDEIIAPKIQIHNSPAGDDPYKALREYHKKKPNIAGYSYDYKNSAGEKVDAGKS